MQVQSVETVVGRYSPRIFDVASIDQARGIILTPDATMTEEQRWLLETPYTLDLMAPMGLGENSVVLDYGCGVGRMSKAMIDRFGCRVIGVDISPSMLALANIYVNSERFAAVRTSMLPALNARFDAAISTWCIQHCRSPKDDVADIAGALRPSGAIFVINEPARFVPVEGGAWVDDGVDVRALLDASFNGEYGSLDDKYVSPTAAKRGAYWFLGCKQ